MHKAIFSPNERKIIEKYIATGKKMHGFRIIKFRIRKYKPTLENDYILLTKLEEKLSTEK